MPDRLQWSEPGIGALRETLENELLWGGSNYEPLLTNGTILGTTRDSGNSPTTVLRRGLLLAQTDNRQFTEYDPTAAFPQNVAVGVLAQEVRITDVDGDNNPGFAPVVVGGAVKTSKVFGLDEQAKNQLLGKIIFDDLPIITYPYQVVEAKTANYTVTAADNGKLFTNRGAGGAVTFTLPTIDRGLRFKFYVEEDQDFTIAAPVANTMVAFNDATATSVSFQTAGERIGGSVEVIANDDESKWLAMVSIADPLQTVTVA